MALDKLFATPVFHVDLPLPAQMMIEHQYNGAKEFIEKDLTATTWGDNISTTFNDGENNALIKYEISGLIEFASSVVNYMTELLYKNTEISLYESWINYQGKHQHQRHHTHPKSMMSAVYYLKSNGQDGKLTFHAPLSTMEQGEPASDEWNFSMIEYPPVQGRLFVFPSWAPHSVGDNMTDDTRISIAMNFR